MALPKGLRGRPGATNGASSGARGGNVKDARDVIREREQRPPNRGVGPSPRILKTAHGLVTNRKAKGISTSQLKNRQSFQSKSSMPIGGGRPPTSKMAVGAAIRKSAVINSNPMLQSVLCLLLPMDSGAIGPNNANNNTNNDSSINLQNNNSPNDNRGRKRRRSESSDSSPAAAETTSASEAEPLDAGSVMAQADSGDDQRPEVGSGGAMNSALRDAETVSDARNDLQSIKEDVNKNNVVNKMSDVATQNSTGDTREEFDRIRDALEKEENFNEEQDNVGAISDGRPADHKPVSKEDLNEAAEPEASHDGHRSEEVRADVDNKVPGTSSAGQSAALSKKGVNFNESKNEVVVIGSADYVERESDWEDSPTDDDKNQRCSESSDLDDFELPTTCRVLKAPNGCVVYLVGTAHFSRESQNDVRRVIRKVRPQCVMVELCEKRMHILTLDEKLLFSEASHLSTRTIWQTIRKMGLLQGSMFLLMMQLSARMASKLNMAPGGEFRIAYQEAQRLQNCRVFLADRQLNITLWRTWANLGVWQRLHIIWNLLTPNADISIEDVERCKEMDMLGQLLGELCDDYPEISRVILTERDAYLCRSLHNIAMTSPAPTSIVAVVGIGHQRGIEKNWPCAEEIDLQELSVVPSPPLSVKITGRVLRITTWVTTGLIVYKLMPRTIKDSLANGIEKGTQNAILDIAGALVQQRCQTAQPVKRPQFVKPARPVRPVARNVDMMVMDVDRRGPVRDRGSDHHHLDRGNPLVSSLSMSLADIPRAAPRAFAPERAALSDRMRGRLDQRQDPPCSVLVSNLHPNVSDNDINELFRTIGPIVTSMFLSPGTALVSYHRKNDAVKAVETYHLRLLDGQPMTCVLLSQDMVPDKHQPSIPGSSVTTAGAPPVRR
ncbi:hypothetical protein BIW11_12670 [Tropilaelaps mercedesae]|uniref:RRM domain-containing protein n=1 Tax=Tropilaelaps mercedesae TaxID=418985 RepID=A0A1V9X5N6_9ACAR|nr:hypothetical protein BIW11_12670 [Tropilaelaps mercedesae]